MQTSPEGKYLHFFLKEKHYDVALRVFTNYVLRLIRSLENRQHHCSCIKKSCMRI